MKETLKSDAPKNNFKSEWRPILKRVATDAAITAARGFVGAIGYKVGITAYDKMFSRTPQTNLRVLPRVNEKIG